MLKPTFEETQQLTARARQAWSDYHEETENVKNLTVLFSVISGLAFCLLAVFSGCVWTEARPFSGLFIGLTVLSPMVIFAGNRIAHIALRRHLVSQLSRIPCSK